MKLIEGTSVTPLRRIDLEKQAVGYLKKYQPEVLKKVKAVDLARLLDYCIYDSHGFSPKIVSGFGSSEIEAQTDFLNKTIEITSECYDSLDVPGRPRFTVGHELGHVVIHSSQFPSLITSLQRTQKAKIETYENPEWQADHFSGALLMPLSTIFPLFSRLRDAEYDSDEIVEEIANEYLVSYSAAIARIKKINQPDLARLAYSIERVTPGGSI